jgi:hypothetical protein
MSVGGLFGKWDWDEACATKGKLLGVDSFDLNALLQVAETHGKIASSIVNPSVLDHLKHANLT